MATATSINIESLKGQKATMLIQNSVGATVLRHITIKDGTRTYKDGFASGLILYYAMKGKRKAEGFTISSKETRLAIVPGWQHVKGMTESVRHKGQFSYDEWVCFGDNEWDSALKQLSSIAYLHG